MKKLCLCTLLLVGSLAVAAQERTVLKSKRSYRSTDTVITFGVFKGDLDEHRRQLKEHIGKPQSENMGTLVWKSQEIAGIGRNLTIKLSDGLMSMDKYQGDAYWELFKNDQDKAEKLKRINSKNWRYMEIEIPDASGGNPINNQDKETTARNFLLKKMGQ